jgi:prepilin-type N-terminal cleavage/methylation domain-containing protein
MPARRRARHRTQLGLTLTELLVAVAILATIGGSLAGALSIGFRLLGPGGAQARLTGSHDLLSFEQQIGADIARADCLRASGQTSVPTGGCAASLQKSPTSCGAGAYILCLAWSVPGSSTCHTVTYTQTATTDTIVRTESPGSGATRFTTGGLVAAASWSTATTTNGYLWTTQVNVAVTQQNTPDAPPAHYATTTFHLVPLVADPMSPVVAAGTSPC